ncbi:MAG: hypothetical protein SV760_07350, partial [Halobacteria archaeon]|nr:hypothetical protein [Halobacteria archaeon]
GGGGGGAGSGGSQGDGSAVAPVYQGENATVSSGREGDSDAGMESFDATKSLNDSTSEKIRSSLNASSENLSGRMEDLYRANRRLQEKVRVLKEQNKELQTSIDAGAEATRAAEPAAHLPPGLLFFAGGFLVLVLGAGWWYWRNGR